MVKTPAKVAKRYHCPKNDYFCYRGTRKPPSDKCRYCGSRLIIDTGLYGVFEWRGDGRYHEEEAKALFLTKPSAERYAEKHSADAWVVRWISKQ